MPHILLFGAGFSRNWGAPPHVLVLGAGFSRNWGAPLASEITGSLLGELHDDPVLAQRLRSGPFEDAFAGFQSPRGDDEASRRLRRLQNAITTSLPV